MNRSAKAGARSSLHEGGEGVHLPPSYPGGCGRHGTEELSVTPGGLTPFPVGTGISNPISGKTKGDAMCLITCTGPTLITSLAPPEKPKPFALKTLLTQRWRGFEGER